MQTKQIKNTAPAKPATDQVATPAPVEVPLDRVIESMRRDALLNPEQYAEETKVPGGGE